jgi:excisionase family DNA binding protein
MIERNYTVSEVAKILGVTPYTVRTYLREGKLEGFKNTDSGRSNNDRWRVKESILKKYLESKHG